MTPAGSELRLSLILMLIIGQERGKKGEENVHIRNRDWTKKEKKKGPLFNHKFTAVNIKKTPFVVPPCEYAVCAYVFDTIYNRVGNAGPHERQQYAFICSYDRFAAVSQHGRPPPPPPPPPRPCAFRI